MAENPIIPSRQCLKEGIMEEFGGEGSVLMADALANLRLVYYTRSIQRSRDVIAFWVEPRQPATMEEQMDLDLAIQQVAVDGNRSGVDALYHTIDTFLMFQGLYNRSYTGPNHRFVPLTRERSDVLCDHFEDMPFFWNDWDDANTLLATVENLHPEGNTPTYKQVVHSHRRIPGAIILSMPFMDLVEQQQLAMQTLSIASKGEEQRMGDGS